MFTKKRINTEFTGELQKLYQESRLLIREQEVRHFESHKETIKDSLRQIAKQGSNQFSTTGLYPIVESTQYRQEVRQELLEGYLKELGLEELSLGWKWRAG